MKQIRQGCFETNSSSMHSLIIKKNDDYLTMDEMEQGMHIYRMGRDYWANKHNSDKIDLDIYNIEEDLYYNRYPFTILSDVRDKLKYYIASECHTKEDILNVEKTLREMFGNIKEIEFSSDTHWGNGDYCQYGYAQNYGGFSEALKENNIDLKEFLTNNKYVVIVDGDEYQEFEKMKETGLIDFRNIYKIYTWPDSACDIYEYDSEGNEISHLEPKLHSMC